MRSDWLDGIGAACAFLSSALLRPHAESLVEALSGPEMIDSWPFDSGSTPDGLELWRGAVITPVSSAAYQADFARLFTGPGKAFVWPFESVHRSEEGLVFEKQTLEVRRAFAQFGVEAPRLHKEPDDHIGLELQFIGLLAAAILDARDLGESESAQELESALRSFVTDHLLTWADVVADAMIEHAETDFYRGTGYVLRGLLEELRVLEVTS